MALMHDYVRWANFTTNSRLGILLNSSLGNSFIQNFAAIKCTPLVVIDRRENSYAFFIIIIIIWIDTRLIKHINLLGLVLLRVNINKIEISNLRINFSSLVTKQIGNVSSQLT